MAVIYKFKEGDYVWFRNEQVVIEDTCVDSSTDKFYLVVNGEGKYYYAKESELEVRD